MYNATQKKCYEDWAKGRAFYKEVRELGTQHEAELGERDARLAALLKERESLLQQRNTLHEGTQALKRMK